MSEIMPYLSKEIYIITAFDQNKLIGNKNKLPWHLPEDLKHFKNTTDGHPILMGRKTYESIGRKLPNRQNIILSTTLQDPDCIQHIKQINNIKSSMPIFVIGGHHVYKALLPYSSRLYITHIHKCFKGDCYFPSIEWSQWRCIQKTHKPVDDQIQYSRDYCIYERI
ncbi:dihydrofolate reductase [Candidatus Comchoanobacter bicostacola]|uniref:Dihydrofolate reductase n=1 Tax=Candidatus Comchoanobacter bicostacola TaxID=2919598 RepID=A0ABY5DLJ7_9GAMM|nr:dihydrofolate reductase [Candidatus Comchoanobacter bicostacola]UTC24729.1 dihydrofolate reductase [Candidatus Comchoanobacter bicostacola]